MSRVSTDQEQQMDAQNPGHQTLGRTRFISRRKNRVVRTFVLPCFRHFSNTMTSVASDPRTLLAAPNPAENPFVVDRKNSTWTNKSDAFTVATTNFERQFSHIYAKRLEALKPRLQERMNSVWPNTTLAPRIIDLASGEQEWMCAGTLYKNMSGKPCVLDEFTEQAILQGLPGPKENYASEEDSLILEDDTGRVSLTMSEGCNLKVEHLVTGVTVGVRGTVTDSGEILVEEMCVADLPVEQHELPSIESSCYVLLLSGLSIGTEGQVGRLQIQLLTDYLSGHLGSPAEQEKVWKHISRVIVCGNTLAVPVPSDDHESISRDQQDLLAAPLRVADSVLGQIARSVPIDIMPGATDPSNVNLPQQPLHEVLLPFTSSFKNNCARVTNPYRAEVDGVELFGHSGQPVDDIKKCTSFTKEIDILEQTLRWQHLAPTAPDTLACYPFYKRDPFVMKNSCPHVMFTGNAPSYDTRLVVGEKGQKVRLIAVPSFSATNAVVLLNLQTLEPTPINFSVNFDGSAASEEA